jgi:signal transduction histidine kinase
VYRIAREALTNAVNHAAGAPGRMALTYAADRVELTVRNDPPPTGAPTTLAASGCG